MAIRTSERASDHILACLRRAPGLTAQQVAGRTHHSYSTVSALLTLLHREGVVDRLPSGELNAWCYFLSKTPPVIPRLTRSYVYV